MSNPMRLPLWLEKIAAYAEFVAVVPIVLFLTWVGPFGTWQDLSLPVRLAYWTGSVAVGFAVVTGYFLYLLPRVLNGPHAKVRAVLIGVVVALLMLADVMVFEALFREPIPMRRLPGVFSNVVAVTLGILAIQLLLRSHRRAHEGLAAVTVSLPPQHRTALHTQLPNEMAAADIIALKAEDHYVRVYTTSGDVLIAGKLGDFMEQVTPLAGQQTHRSWWVADWAVREWLKEGRNDRLLLEGGIKAQVSRTRSVELKRLGWGRSATVPLKGDVE